MALQRSAPENYNPQIHTEELSLVSQSDKHMAVHNQVLDRFSQYNKITSFLYHSGRINGGVKNGRIKKERNASKTVHDNAYRVQKWGALIKPAISMGSAVFGDYHDAGNPNPDMTSVVGVTYQNGIDATSMTTDVKGSIALKHDPENGIDGNKFNPTDTISFDQGLGGNFIIQNIRMASTRDHVILDGKYIGTPQDFDEDHLEENEVFMEAGNFQGEGSLRGYQRNRDKFWDIYYSFISRYTLTFTGSALDQQRVIWCAPTAADAAKGKNGPGFWQYEQEWLADQYMALFLELALRNSVSSMDPSTHQWFGSAGKNLLTMGGFSPESGITPPRLPDGWLAQIKGTIDLSYDVNTGFSVYFLETLFSLLAGNSPAGSSGNHFLIVGDQIAETWWDRNMKKLMGWNTTGVGQGYENVNHVFNHQSGSTVDVGFNVGSYIYKHNKYSFVLDELMTHPGLNASHGGLTGKGHFYVLNMSMVDGVSNFEIFSRGRGRLFKKKYIDGMHSLDKGRDAGNVASSGFDGARVDYLSDLFPICYAPEACAVVRGTGKYNGGGLQGTDLSSFPYYK